MTNRTKYKITWTGNWKRGWNLSYRWYDEGGGGWSTVGESRFRWVLRLVARIHRFFRERDIGKLGVEEKFEL